MNRNTIRIIIILASFLLIGLVTTQIFWVKKAYNLQKKQFDHDVTLALKNVAQEILLHSKDSAQLYDPVKKVTENYFQVAINDILDPYYLESLLKREFQKQELNINFEYGIYDCFSDSVVFHKSITIINEENETQQATAPQIKWERDGHYFGVYFPNKNEAIVSHLNFWIISSIFLFAVVIFFSYTISIMLKQKRLSEVKNDFINNMTHELKTPISTISLSAEVLMNPEIVKFPDRLLNYAQIINSENNRLKNQVERVLQLATLDKEIELKKTTININEVIANAIISFQLVLQEKGGKINLNLAENIPIIEADEIHIVNIIQNLIDNAIKYTNQAPIINITTSATNKGIKIAIADNGIGIKEAYISQIFDKFFRVPTGNIHNVKGFGLGLNYVKTMVDIHHGVIKIDSKIDAGSTFTLFFPFK